MAALQQDFRSWILEIAGTFVKEVSDLLSGTD
jgi:hypothetical protein